jgi:hypothetical protein
MISRTDGLNEIKCEHEPPKAKRKGILNASGSMPNMTKFDVMINIAPLICIRKMGELVRKLAKGRELQILS